MTNEPKGKAMAPDYERAGETAHRILAHASDFAEPLLNLASAHVEFATAPIKTESECPKCGSRQVVVVIHQSKPHTTPSPAGQQGEAMPVGDVDHAAAKSYADWFAHHDRKLGDTDARVVLARAYLALRASARPTLSMLTDAQMEAACRAICVSDGSDPDETDRDWPGQRHAVLAVVNALASAPAAMAEGKGEVK